MGALWELEPACVWVEEPTGDTRSSAPLLGSPQVQGAGGTRGGAHVTGLARHSPLGYGAGHPKQQSWPLAQPRLQTGPTGCPPGSVLGGVGGAGAVAAVTLVGCGLQPGDAAGGAAASGSRDSGQCPSAPRPHPLLGDRGCSSGWKLQGRWLWEKLLKARSQAVPLPFFLWGLRCCQHLPPCSAPSGSSRLQGVEGPPPTWSRAWSGRGGHPGRTHPWKEPRPRPQVHSGLHQPVPLPRCCPSHHQPVRTLSPSWQLPAHWSLDR